MTDTYTTMTDEELLRAVLADETLRYHFALNSGAGPVHNQGKEIFRAVERAAIEAYRRQQWISVEDRLPPAETDGGDKARAALAQQPSAPDHEGAADMFWDADDPERFGGDNLHDALVDMADNYGDPDFPVTVRLQCAKRLPDVQLVVTGRNEDDGLVYEVIDAARAAKGADHA